LGLGATFGDGSQWMSWVHVKDLQNLLLYAAANSKIDEVLNGSAPEPVTNRAFTKALGAALHRPAFLSVPKFALRAALGEMSGFLFDSLRVIPEAATRAGFDYHFGTLAQALTDLTN
jgi:NAD dependent epimerase/dehydratase family enzyme